jgi:hypothetical protein
LALLIQAWIESIHHLGEESRRELAFDGAGTTMSLSRIFTIITDMGLLSGHSYVHFVRKLEFMLCELLSKMKMEWLLGFRNKLWHWASNGAWISASALSM